MVDPQSTVPPQLPEQPPRLSPSAFPSQERDAVSRIESALDELDSFAGDLGAALALFNFSAAQGASAGVQVEVGRLMSRWQFIAAKQGAMIIHDFGTALSDIFGMFGGCPTLKSMVRLAQLREAAKTFRKAFPKFERLRHSTAHPETRRRAPARHSVGRGTIIHSRLQGSLFSMTFEGQLVS
jgi:hypothetical protein